VRELLVPILPARLERAANGLGCCCIHCA